mgnify:CR=1 FL=1
MKKENDIWDIFNNYDEQFENKDKLHLNNKQELDKNFCEYCDTNTLIYEDGYLYCNSCGIYQQKHLNEDVEYRFYGESDNKTNNPERVGMPTNHLLPESSLGSMIGYRNYDSHNFKKMIKYNSWNAMPYKERSQWKVFLKIANKANNAGLPSIIIEEAKNNWKIISDNNISRGANKEGIIASCVYMACKKMNVPRSSKEIADIFGIDSHNMTKGNKRFKEIWRLNKNNSNIKMKNSNSLDYIDRFCSKLKLPNYIKHIAEFVGVKSMISVNNLVEDNTSPSIAAGAIFLVCNICNYNINKKQVSNACKTSEVTISKCYKKMCKHKISLLPKSIIEKYNII